MTTDWLTHRKTAVLANMLPLNNMPLGRLAKEEGISVATLAKWRAEPRAKGQFLPDANAAPEGWSSEDQLAAVIGERLRRHRFETNRERVAERGETWRVLPPPWELCRAARHLARGLRARQ